jgi:CelD/BcsL family acetyltransferase involved in cellulose biosynthesis
MNATWISVAPGIAQVDPLRIDWWDDFVARWPHAGVFHTRAWARTLVETYAFSPRYLLLSDQDQPRAALPMMEVDGWWKGRRGVSLPFSDYCPALTREPDDLRRLVEAAMRMATARGWRSIDYRGPLDEASNAEPHASYYMHTIDLDGDEASIWRGLRPAVRRAIHKARKSGLQVQCGGDDAQLAALYRLQTMTRRRHGLPPQPRRFFRVLQRHFLTQGGGNIVTVHNHGEPVAAALFLRFADRGLYKIAASDMRYQAWRPNDLAMWEGIRWCRTYGCRELSLGRTDLNHEGLRRFKDGWGGSEQVVQTYRYHVAARAYVQGDDLIAGAHNHVFRHLPTPVLQWAGSVLYRQTA